MSQCLRPACTIGKSCFCHGMETHTVMILLGKENDYFLWGWLYIKFLASCTHACASHAKIKLRPVIETVKMSCKMIRFKLVTRKSSAIYDRPRNAPPATTVTM